MSSRAAKFLTRKITSAQKFNSAHKLQQQKNFQPQILIFRQAKIKLGSEWAITATDTTLLQTDKINSKI